MRISFFGACSEVSGSNILLEAENKHILIECGLFQGNRASEERNYAPFGYDPKEIDVIILGHAHLDHVGRLPKLVREGFRGKIFSTPPTKELANLVLLDNEKLMEEESRRNRHRTLYEKEDIERVMQLFETIGYHETIEVVPGVKLTFKNAGHILGSAVSVIEAEGKKLVYTSDLGNNPSLLMDPPEIIDSADFLICESTYGGRVHEDVNLRQSKLSEVINATVAQNGVLIIPTFAIERTQELLHDIDHIADHNVRSNLSFYLDSPLAEKVTAVFKKYPEYISSKLRQEHDTDFYGLERLHMASSVDQSKAINDAPNPKVIIAGSGMMNGGRILYHAREYLPGEKNALLIVGYQAEGTLGRRLAEGDGTVKIFGENVVVRAKVKKIGSYSAHADEPQLLAYIKNIRNLNKVFLAHGERDQAELLSEAIKKDFGIETFIPNLTQVYEL